MAAVACRWLRASRENLGFKTLHQVRKAWLCTEQSLTDKSKNKLSGFAESYIKQSSICNEVPKEESFAALLRKSKFISLGDPGGKKVLGTIYHVSGDDLYIDFGWKFPTVCTKPKKNENLYVKGAQVILLIKDLELSNRFLGGTTDITLLEADCVLIGLAKTNNN